MSMLFQQIRRGTFPRKAALTPPSPLAFSRFFSTTNWALGHEKETIVGRPWGEFLWKYGLTYSYAFGLCYLTDFAGYRKSNADWATIDEEIKEAWDEAFMDEMWPNLKESGK